MAVAAGCGEDRAKAAIVRSVLGDEFDPRFGGDGRVPRAEVLCARAAAAGAGVVPAAVLLAADVCATAAEAREAVAEAVAEAGEGGGCTGGVRGVLSRYLRHSR